MSDEEIIDALRAKRGELCPVELAILLGTLRPDGLTDASLISYFFRAFQIPLKTLWDAALWNRVSRGDLDDAGFNELLAPWLGAQRDPGPDEQVREALRGMRGHDFIAIAREIDELCAGGLSFKLGNRAVPVTELADIYRSRAQAPFAEARRARQFASVADAAEAHLGEAWFIHHATVGQTCYVVFANEQNLGRACLALEATAPCDLSV